MLARPSTLALAFLLISSMAVASYSTLLSLPNVAEIGGGEELVPKVNAYVRRTRLNLIIPFFSHERIDSVTVDIVVSSAGSYLVMVEVRVPGCVATGSATISGSMTVTIDVNPNCVYPDTAPVKVDVSVLTV